MKKKKILSLLLAGVMAVSLTACGGGSASNEGSASSADSSASTASSTASATSSSASGTASAEATPVSGGQLIIGDGTQSNGDIYPY